MNLVYQVLFLLTLASLFVFCALFVLAHLADSTPIARLSARFLLSFGAIGAAAAAAKLTLAFGIGQ
jgi:hypothetical protein